MSRPRIAALLLATLLSACATPAAQVPAPSASPAPTETPTPIPTALPSPTPEPVFAAGSELAGVDVSGLNAEAALAAVSSAAKAPALRLRLPNGRTVIIAPGAIGAAYDLSGLRTLAPQPEPVVASAPISYDRAALRARLTAIAETTDVGGGAAVLIDAEQPISRSFALTPAITLDLAATGAAIAERLASGTAGPVDAVLAVSAPQKPSVAAIEAELTAMAEEWPGVAGVYLYDLASGAEITINAESVFAGASTIKAAIMLNFFANVERITAQQRGWLDEMIVESDNLAANDLMSAAMGSRGTEAAFRGAEQMSDMLAELGLENLYLYVPYESTDYIRQNNVRYRCGPRDPVGPAPYTETGCALRATPYAMGQVYRWIDECVREEGPLPAYSALLTPARCQAMLDLLATNGDEIRFRSGLPTDLRLEHKSGWIENMQADCGITRSDGGDYVLCVYLYRPLTGGRFMWNDNQMAPYLGMFARLVYTAYNPEG